MIEFQTEFFQHNNGCMTVPCPFGIDARVGSTACLCCESFIKDTWIKKVSFDAPTQGTIYCYGGYKKSFVYRSEDNKPHEEIPAGCEDINSEKIARNALYKSLIPTDIKIEQKLDEIIGLLNKIIDKG